MFVISWFAGLFYLPRIYVNLADIDDAPTRERLLTMARKLLKFMTRIGVLAIVFGMALWGYGVGRPGGWMHVLVPVLGLVAYHAYCAVLYQCFSRGTDVRTRVWFRWFNEVPVLALFAIVALAVGKPF